MGGGGAPYYIFLFCKSVHSYRCYFELRCLPTVRARYICGVLGVTLGKLENMSCINIKFLCQKLSREILLHYFDVELHPLKDDSLKGRLRGTLTAESASSGREAMSKNL